MSDKRRWSEHPLVQLTQVRYREFFREPEAVFWVFIFPVLLAAGLGIAFRNRAPDIASVAVVNTDTSAVRTAEALRRSRDLEVSLMSDAAAAEALRTGDVALVMVPGGKSGVEYRYDDTRPESQVARLMVDDALQRAAGRRDPVQARERLVYERGSRYIDFLVPGLLGMNLMGSGIWGVGFAIVDARKKRLLKRLIATPMSRPQYLASFVVSRLTLLVIEVGLLLGFGLLVSSRVQTMEGASGLMNLVMLPMWIFSGVFFSASRFPEPLQPFIQALPLTAVVDVLRANILRGAGWQVLAPDIAIIVAWM